MVSDCLSDAGVGNEMLTSSLKSKLIALFPETERHVKELCREEAPRDPLAEGMVAFETGNYDAALPLLTEVLEAEPFRVQVWVTVGKIHQALGEFEKAEEHFYSAHCMDPAHDRVAYHLGEVAHARQDYITAEHYFQMAVAQNPNFTDGFIRLGITYLDQKRNAEAVKAFERAVYLDRKAVVAHYYLAQICIEQKDLKRAMVQLHLVKQLKPDYAPAYLMLAEIFERIKDYRQAFIELKKVVALKAATGPVFLKLGKIQLVLQNRENALSFFLEAKAVEPTCFEAYYQAAILQEDMNYLEPALANYEALLGTRKYREIAQMAVMRIRTLLDEMRAAMGDEAGAKEEAPSNITPFRGTGPLNRTAAMPA